DPGVDGQNGIAPQVRINTTTGRWEISMDNGATWSDTGVKATGEKGDPCVDCTGGECIFASVDASNPNRIVFTLADGSTIEVPRYQALGIDFGQPEPFTAGETKIVHYTTRGNVTGIQAVSLPAGWTLDVNLSTATIAITAPGDFAPDAQPVQAILLVYGDQQLVIACPLSLIPVTGTTVIAIDGHDENTIRIEYTDGTTDVIPAAAAGTFIVANNTKVIRSIIAGNLSILAGRKVNGQPISLKIAGGSLVLRDPDSGGVIPIGTYDEFQLINQNLSGNYKQEADIDLLDVEWVPVGKFVDYVSYYFTGTFDGDNHALANLRVSGTNDRVGLFGYTGGATIQNVHVVSGSVSGGAMVGGICGETIVTSITNCSNASTVTGSGDEVGGVCGHAIDISIQACYNTGDVTGRNTVGGVCGRAVATTSSFLLIQACYNTGEITGKENVGGVCGVANAIFLSIQACYNTGDVTGRNNVGGVCGQAATTNTSSPFISIQACYNTGDVTGSGNNVGGVCGQAYAKTSSSSILIQACYNTGEVMGDGNNVGGVCGRAYVGSIISSSILIQACYNTGEVTGSGNNVGGVCGSTEAPAAQIIQLQACYWKNVAGDNADHAIGFSQVDNSTSDAGASMFSASAWPTVVTHTQWGTGDGSGDGKYWKSLGQWNGGNPVYPSLYFE
ncbi:MAG: hypothetical protein LBP56_07950, partial [Odoribacteraceae bacterium]|nr:hypothetical protein [Odoribacteraceae bacterium]